MHQDCPFCSIDPDRVVFSDDSHGDAIWDAFPVNPGHILIVPRRHAATWDDLTDVEKAWAWSAVDQAIAVIRADHSPEGFNVGFNLGTAAGQTVFHFHLHVIPRYMGDVEDPRGGVRHVIPAKGNYLPEKTISKLQQQLIKGGDDPFLPHLILHLDGADRCDIAVAFLLDSGARCIIEHLKDFLDRGGQARILVSDYLDVTEPIALRRVADLEGALSLKIYETQVQAFHLKSYAFAKGSEGIAFVGSSNLSETALTTSLEWNYKVVSARDVLGFRQIREGFDELFNHSSSISVGEEWIEQYERRRRLPDRIRESGVADEEPVPIPQPHSLQREALNALVATRNDGFTAGLVVLATGLGKTWLAAFDSDHPEFRRVLFVAHREEILNQAIQVFRQIRPNARIGRLSGEQRETHADLLFASVQTLSRMPHLSQFKPDDFDYIVVDEFHHAAAGTRGFLCQSIRHKRP